MPFGASKRLKEIDPRATGIFRVYISNYPINASRRIGSLYVLFIGRLIERNKIFPGPPSPISAWLSLLSLVSIHLPTVAELRVKVPPAHNDGVSSWPA